MTNVVKFKMKEVPAALSEMYVRVTDTDRNELYSGFQSVDGDDIELNLGTLGTINQGVLVHGDNYNGSNALTFKSFSGYSLVGVGSNTPSPIENRLVPDLNGSNQWITTPEMRLVGDFSLSLDVRVLSFLNFSGVFGGAVASMRQFSEDGTMQLSNFAGRYDSFSIPNSTENKTVSIVIARTSNKLVVSMSDTDGKNPVELVNQTCNLDDISLTEFGRNFSGRSSVRIYNIKLDDGLLHDYPCDDGYENNPTIRNRGAAGDAEMFSATPDTWKNIIEIPSDLSSVGLTESGVMSGFRVVPSNAGEGNTDVRLSGNVFNMEKGEFINLSSASLDLVAGDKYIVMNKQDNTIQTITTEPTIDHILLCTLGYVFNPYEPERNGTVEGIPDNWATKNLAKSSFLWHPIAINDDEAKIAHNKFHSGDTPYHTPNSGLSGCALNKEDMTLVSGTTSLDSYRLASNTNVEGLYLDGGSLIIDDGCKDSLLKNFIVEGNNLLFYFMIKPSKGDGWVDSENVVLENVTFSFFDEVPEVWNSNADGVKLPKGITIKNIKAYNCPNDPFKIESGVTYDGFEAYNLGYKDGSHCDGFQGSGSFERVQEGCVIKNGTIWMPDLESINPTIGQQGTVNGCIYFDGDFGPEDSVDRVAIRDVTIEDCFFNGGIHSLWVYNHSGDNWKIEDIKFRNIMLGLDFSRSFATDLSHTTQTGSQDGEGISVWENVRRIDNGELLEKPSPSRPFIAY